MLMPHLHLATVERHGFGHGIDHAGRPSASAVSRRSHVFTIMANSSPPSRPT